MCLESSSVVFVLSVAIFAALGLGFALGEFGLFGVHAGSDQDGAYRQMRVYAEVLKKIQTDYVTEPNINDVTTGALHGLLESLDSDSSYLTPTEYKIYKDRPATGVAQVGITVSKRFGYATMVTVLPGSPADQEHLADGDVIESIGEQSTRELSLAVIRLMLEGKPGTTVDALRGASAQGRSGQADAHPLRRRRRRRWPSSSMRTPRILYLKPGVLTAARVDEIAAKLKSAGKGHKMLLDLRDSTGDDPQQGVRLANFFLKQGTIATLKGRSSPPRPSPPTRRCSSPTRRWRCWSIAAPTARRSSTAAAIRRVKARRRGGRAHLRRGLGAEDDRTAGRRGAAADRGQVRGPGRQEDSG